jgi:hypothetical protein
MAGVALIVRHQKLYRTGLYRAGLLATLLVAPLLAGCAGSGGDMFQTDLLSKDADWFSRPGRVFVRNVSIEAPPLSPNTAVGPQDLISADGACPGMAPRGEASALADGGAPASGGVVALGHTECDVARNAGAPDNVNLSANPRGDRVAVLTYSRGPRAGVYTFTSGRLTMVEGSPDAAPAAKPTRAKSKKRAAS